MLHLHLQRELSNQTLLIAQFTPRRREPWLSVSGCLLSPTTFTGVLGCGGGRRDWLSLSAKSLSQVPAQVFGWILTIWSWSFESLDRLSDISWQQALLYLGQRSAEQTVLLWSIGEVWPKELYQTSPLIAILVLCIHIMYCEIRLDFRRVLQI